MVANGFDDDQTRSFTALAAGTIVSHYKIISKIGAGGMGEVYLAEDTQLDRKVALKFLPPHLSQDEPARARFTREAKASAKLDHPNIVQVFEVGEFQGRPFFAMAHIEGKSLREVIKESKLSINEAIEFTKQICEGLHKAHESGIVHRDIKPGNIIIDRDNKPRLLDFGLATVAGEDKLTKTGSTLGTVGYMSPEQIEGKTVDHRSDLFSVGVILYEMLTGRRPFEGDTDAAVARSITDTSPEPIARYKSGTTGELQRIVDKALTKDPTLRYQHADGMLSDLKAQPEMGPDSGLSAVGSGQKTLVVLPFENLGSPEDDYFADGITDEMVSKLARNRDLRLISRTTARQYKATSKSLPAIASELRVDFVLEGTIRWDKSHDVHRVRINTRLIQASDDIQLWSRTYQKDMKDIFEIQESVAFEVANALNLAVKTVEQPGDVGVLTENQAAYQAYLYGIDCTNRMDYHEDDLRMAFQMFERAINLDPEFAAAHAELSRSYSALYHFGYDRRENRVKKALKAALYALELKPGLPEGHFALGSYYYWIKRDYEEGLEHLRIAESALPNDVRIKKLISAISLRIGNLEDALRQDREVLEMSPKDPLAAHSLALTCIFMRRNQEADAHYSQSIAQNPDQEFGYLFKAWNFWNWRGDLELARGILEQIPASNKPRTNWYWYIGYLQRLFERDYRANLNWLEKCPVEILGQQMFFIPKTLLQAVVYHIMGDSDRSRELGDSSRCKLEACLEGLPDDYRIHGSLGVAYAIMGMHDQAIVHGKRGLDLCPPSKDALNGPARVDDMAFIHALLEEHDEAINQIEILLSIPSTLSAPICRLDPRWDSIREHPRFKALIAKYGSK